LTELALKPSLAGEGLGEEALNKPLFTMPFFSIFKNKEKKEKRIYFNASSPTPLGNSSCIALLT